MPFTLTFLFIPHRPTERCYWPWHRLPARQRNFPSLPVLTCLVQAVTTDMLSQACCGCILDVLLPRNMMALSEIWWLRLSPDVHSGLNAAIQLGKGKCINSVLSQNFSIFSQCAARDKLANYWNEGQSATILKWLKCMCQFRVRYLHMGS